MTDRVKQVARIAYEFRSRTGHRGSVFGSEKTFGYAPHLPLFQVADETVFDYGILGQLRTPAAGSWPRHSAGRTEPHHHQCR